MTRDQRNHGQTAVVHRMASDADARPVNARREPGRVHVVRLRAGSVQSQVLHLIEQRDASRVGEMLAALPYLRRHAIDEALSDLLVAGYIRRLERGVYGPGGGPVRSLPGGGLSLVDGSVAVIVPAAFVGHIREFLGSDERGEHDR